jgi:5'(3')-deoxyribonucleotidase
MQEIESAIPAWESVARAAWNAKGVKWPPVIGLDCDGVLASDRLLWQHLWRSYPGHIPARYEDLRTFEWPRATRETEALCRKLSADREFVTLLNPIPHMAEALRWLHEAGYTMYVITARPASVLGATRRWLRMQGVSDYVEEIYCVESGSAKVPLALELHCQAFVEDNHATAEAMGQAHVRSYLLDAPYNRLPNQYSLRVDGWPGLLLDLAETMDRTLAPATGAWHADLCLPIPAASTDVAGRDKLLVAH